MQNSLPQKEGDSRLLSGSSALKKKFVVMTKVMAARNGLPRCGVVVIVAMGLLRNGFGAYEWCSINTWDHERRMPCASR